MTQRSNLVYHLSLYRNFGYFLHQTLDCANAHWTPQVDQIDFKWWGVMDFKGHLEKGSDDAEKLLKSLVHSTNGTTVWDNVGKSGWGREGNNAFMLQNTAHHATNAHDKLMTCYTPCTEMLVEKYYAREWSQNDVHFEKFHLFIEIDYLAYEGCGVGQVTLAATVDTASCVVIRMGVEKTGTTSIQLASDY